MTPPRVASDGDHQHSSMTCSRLWLEKELERVSQEQDELVAKLEAHLDFERDSRRHGLDNELRRQQRTKLQQRDHVIADLRHQLEATQDSQVLHVQKDRHILRRSNTPALSSRLRTSARQTCCESSSPRSRREKLQLPRSVSFRSNSRPHCCVVRCASWIRCHRRLHLQCSMLYG